MRVSLLGQVNSSNLWDPKVGLGRMVHKIERFFKKCPNSIARCAGIELLEADSRPTITQPVCAPTWDSPSTLSWGIHGVRKLKATVVRMIGIDFCQDFDTGFIRTCVLVVQFRMDRIGIVYEDL